MTSGTSWNIGSANCGPSGASKGILAKYTSHGRIGQINWEPASGVTIPSVVEAESAGTLELGGARIQTGPVDQIVHLLTGGGFVGPALTHIGPVSNGGGTVNTNLIVISNHPSSQTNVFANPIAVVTNSVGSTLTNPVVCLGDVAKKASTGTGYDGGTNDTRL